MKKNILSALICAGAGLSAYALDATAQQVAPAVVAPAASSPLAPVLADISVITATVDAIDAAQRTVILKDAQGHTAFLRVPKSVTNFDTIKKGDKFVVEYAESIAVGLATAPKGTQPGVSDMRQVTVNASGVQRPFAEVTDTIFASAKITYIDQVKRIAVLQGPEGKSIRVKVDKQVLGLENFKVGDEVIIEYVHNMVVGFTPPVADK